MLGSPHCLILSVVALICVGDASGADCFWHQNTPEKVRGILAKFGFTNPRPSFIPLDPGLKLFPTEITVSPSSASANVTNTNNASDADSDGVESEEGNGLKADRYREIVGSLMYLMVSTRPDIAFAVGYLARFMNCHDNTHLQAAGQVLKYLSRTRDRGIIYHRSDKFELVGYSDSDWGTDVTTRRSVTGYLFKLANGPVSWKSRLQPTVALSSSESEYMALSAAAQEALALRGLCSDFGLDASRPVLIYSNGTKSNALCED
jgi:hypothetical protein